MTAVVGWWLWAVAAATDPTWSENFAAYAEESHSMSLSEIPAVDPDHYFSPDCSR